MSFFSRPDYQSEITHFLEDLKKQDPTLESKQREGRQLLWDKPVNTELMSEFDAARIPQAPYVYQTKGHA